jgi:hypothetical protein
MSTQTSREWWDLSCGSEYLKPDQQESSAGAGETTPL